MRPAPNTLYSVLSASPGFPPLHYVVRHRLRVMPFGEAPTVIAISSPHRKEVFVGGEYLCFDPEEGSVREWGATVESESSSDLEAIPSG